MKLFQSTSGRQLRRSTIATALTVLVVALVLVVNVVFSAFASRGLWYIDLTTYTRKTSSGSEDYELYTLTPGCISLLE